MPDPIQGEVEGSRMRRRSLIIAFVVLIAAVGGAFLLGVSAYVVFSAGSGETVFAGGDVGLVKVIGGIFDPDSTIKELEKYREDNSIKAVVLRIESPGGSVAASQEIYSAVKRLSAVKPVVASMGSVAASGGYYIACGANQVVANPGTITGSIGVRMEHVKIADLMRWAKIEHETLKSGKFKDMGSPDRSLSAEEREILESVLKQLHKQFKDAVMEARNFDGNDIEKVADGRIFSGEEAKNLHLVDALGSLYDATKLAGVLANIKGEPKLIEKYKTRQNWTEYFFETALSGLKDFSFKNVKNLENDMPVYMMY